MPNLSRIFAQVSFLADRRKNGKISNEDLHRMAAAQQAGRGASGVDFYRSWLGGLDREYGRKLADSIRMVLALLAAIEEAHDWVFEEGRKVDPATKGVLTPLSERFEGVKIDLLARLLDLDRPTALAHDRIDPGLLFTLQRLQGVLMVSRADRGASQFRLALKEFLPAARSDPALGPMLKQMHARIAMRALDAAHAVEKSAKDSGQDWSQFEELAPFVEACVTLSGSELLAKRWDPDGLAAFILRLDAGWFELARAAARVPWLTQAAAWLAPLSTTDFSATPSDRRNHLAEALHARGGAWFRALDLRAAIADYDAAIKLGEDLRDWLRAQGLAWPPDYQNDLAKDYASRGIVKGYAIGPAAAIADYDAAIGLMEGLRDALRAQGLHWPPDYQSDLAGSYTNRGNAKHDAMGPTEALPDFDAAMEILNALCGQGLAYSPAWANDRVQFYKLRGAAIAQAIGPAAAIVDYDYAIKLGEGLRDVLRAQGLTWPPDYQNDLAGAYVNRGSAKSDAFGPAAAIADYDAAIGLMEGLRDGLRVQGLAWPRGYQDDLAKAYMNRGVDKRLAIGPAAAIADYDAAIGLREGLRDGLRATGRTWPPDYQEGLAKSYTNRGNAKWQLNEPTAAIGDYDAAIEVMQQLRLTIGEVNWSATPAFNKTPRRIEAILASIP